MSELEKAFKIIGNQPASPVQGAASSEVEVLSKRLTAMGATKFSFAPGSNPNATPEQIAAEINKALDQVESGAASSAASSGEVNSQQAAPEAPNEPIYQVQHQGESGSSAWRDASEAAYHTFMPERRRIVYAAQPSATEQAKIVATVIKNGADRQWMSEALGSLPDGIYSLCLATPAPEQAKADDLAQAAESNVMPPVAAPVSQHDAATSDDFARGVIAALGVLTAHGYTHGTVFHDEIIHSVGEASIYAAADDEDYAWAGLNPRKKPKRTRRAANTNKGEQP